ncbi:hypothetical protein [Curtobacterium oceanosedimentum]|uniref:GHMP family kinase ATP-binding protein n=1 Tax=Curtobacterium oceanosedimentum TaxID=465820 RepID=UPI00137AC2F8|nr:hypothetical protein [Curtobacterium oceanosedimentum]
MSLDAGVEVTYANPSAQPNTIDLDLLQTWRGDALEHVPDPFVRALLRRAPAGFVHMRSKARVPAGSGLGSSAAFTLAALAAVTGEYDAMRLIRGAADVEAEVLGRRLGIQDQTISAIGGFVDLSTDGTEVEARRLPISEAAVRQLQTHMLLVHTGVVRNAGMVLREQIDEGRHPLRNRDAVLMQIRDLVDPALAALETGDVVGLGAILQQHWSLKRSLSAHNENKSSWGLVDVAMQNGALGAKLNGAGAGGTILILVRPGDRRSVVDALAILGARELNLGLGTHGLTRR